MAVELQPLRIFAVSAPGLEPLTAAELRAVGIDARVEPGGASWVGTEADLHTANLHLRSASRVLVRISEFRARTFFELERHARKAPWEAYVSPGESIGFRVTSTKSKLYHGGAIAERMLDAAARRVGPLVSSIDKDAGDDQETISADQLFVVRAHRDHCTISADTSGELLHRRGYREAIGKAPLRETLAAATILGSGWNPAAPLIDPLCGSGTIPIEAALIARRIPPGLANSSLEPRGYRHLKWPASSRTGWEDVVSRAREGVIGNTGAPIHGSDRDTGAIESAASNAQRAGVDGDIELFTRSISDLEPPGGTGWLVTNPPYGLRIGERAPLRNLYATLGRVARERLHGWTVALLAADPRYDSQLAIPLKEVLHTRNGGIPVRLMVGVLAD